MSATAAGTNIEASVDVTLRVRRHPVRQPAMNLLLASLGVAARSTPCRPGAEAGGLPALTGIGLRPERLEIYRLLAVLLDVCDGVSGRGREPAS